MEVTAVELYLVLGLVIGFFSGTIAGGLPRNDGDVTFQTKRMVLYGRKKSVLPISTR